MGTVISLIYNIIFVGVDIFPDKVCIYKDVWLKLDIHVYIICDPSFLICLREVFYNTVTYRPIPRIFHGGPLISKRWIF